MPDIEAEIEFLSNLPIYKHQKPFRVTSPTYSNINGLATTSTLSSHSGNVVFERRKILISDLRNSNVDKKLATNGFQMYKHISRNLGLEDIGRVGAYKAEMDEFVGKMVFPDAVWVQTFNFQVRKNIPHEARTPGTFYKNTPFRIKYPVVGAHDVTPNHAASILERHLPSSQKLQYLNPSHRVRLISTWRPLNLPFLKDRPLAFCDYQSLNPSDILTADDIRGKRVREVYCVKYNPEQKWYWISEQTPEEVLVMVMWDSKPGEEEAKYCLHSSFDIREGNRGGAREGEVRESVETRAIVITRN